LDITAFAQIQTSNGNLHTINDFSETKVTSAATAI